jgi:hypothetical protein
MSRDELIARAKERAVAGGGDDEWGEKIAELDDEAGVFVGRFRGEAEDENYDGHGGRVHLAWDEAGQPVWVRGKWHLNVEFDRVRPAVGDTIVIAVGEAWEGKSGTSGFYYGVEAEPNSEPLPQTGAIATGETSAGIPFEPVL